MKKKIALIALLAAPTSYASEKTSAGYYVGVGLGYGQLSVKRGEAISGGGNYSVSTLSSGAKSNSKPVLSVFSGYDKHFSNTLLLGGEVQLNLPFYNNTYNNSCADTVVTGYRHVIKSTVKNTVNLKALFKFGKSLGEHQVYAAFGVNFARYDIDTTATFLTTGSTVVATLGDSYSSHNSKTRYAFAPVLGIGFTISKINCCYGVLATYQPNMHFLKFSNDVTSLNGTTFPFSHKFKSSEFSLMLRISKKF